MIKFDCIDDLREHWNKIMRWNYEYDMEGTNTFTKGKRKLCKEYELESKQLRKIGKVITYTPRLKRCNMDGKDLDLCYYCGMEVSEKHKEDLKSRFQNMRCKFQHKLNDEEREIVCNNCCLNKFRVHYFEMIFD